MISMVKIQVAIIWCINGQVIKKGESLHPFGPTLKYNAIGIETSTPQIAALLVVFLQNNPSINTAKIPGLTTPVYS